MKKNKIFKLGFIFLIGISSCKNVFNEYQISDSYSGACVIFIKSNINDSMDDHKIKIKDGLAKISKKNSLNKFIFRSIENNDEIEIIQIGQSNYTKDEIRYIFDLTKGNFSSEYSGLDIEIISFFVGTKNEYLK